MSVRKDKKIRGHHKQICELLQCLNPLFEEAGIDDYSYDLGHANHVKIKFNHRGRNKMLVASGTTGDRRRNQHARSNLRRLIADA